LPIEISPYARLTGEGWEGERSPFAAKYYRLELFTMMQGGGPMAYYLDAEKIRMDDLRKRIEDTDLVPSRVSLLDGIQKKIKALEGQGILTLAQLRTGLNNTKRLESLSKKSGVDSKYLILLRRETEGWFPKPSPLKAFDCLPKGEIVKLEKSGIMETASLHAATWSAKQRAEFVKKNHVDAETLDSISRCAELTRVQWVSPTTARMLVDAGCGGVSALAAADPERLCAALERINKGNKYFKGKIGLRGVKRIIRAAGYLAKW
jgi:hypothetical protein